MGWIEVGWDGSRGEREDSGREREEGLPFELTWQFAGEGDDHINDHREEQHELRTAEGQGPAWAMALPWSLAQTIGRWSLARTSSSRPRVKSSQVARSSHVKSSRARTSL
jgi:hypothetical protein